MDELRRTQAESTMAQPEFSRSMAEMDHSQVGLPRLLDTNEISQPPHERMIKLEAAIAELKEFMLNAQHLKFNSWNRQGLMFKFSLHHSRA